MKTLDDKRVTAFNLLVDKYEKEIDKKLENMNPSRYAENVRVDLSEKINKDLEKALKALYMAAGWKDFEWVDNQTTGNYVILWFEDNKKW